MRVVIVEDNFSALNSLKRELSEVYPLIEVVNEVKTVDEAITIINETDFELLFLDVELPDGNCFDILKRIDYKKYKIIFTTAFSEYAVNAFRFCAIDYLLKPLKTSELKEAIEKATAQNKDDEALKVETLLVNQTVENKKIALTNSDGTYIVELNEIIYIEADGNYVKVYVKGEKKYFLISKTLKHFDKLLTNQGFIRVHHAFIVNVEFIRKYVSKDGSYIILKNKVNVPVSQRKKSKLVTLINNVDSSIFL